MVKPSKGRQKIEISKLDNEANLLVTFSKRRAGLFKKASELATLCGVEFALIIYSPTKKSFSFGNPNVDAVVDRYLNGNVGLAADDDDPTARLLEVQRCARVRELNRQLSQALEGLDAARSHAKEVKRVLQANTSDNWWEKPVPELTLPQLEDLKLALVELRKDVNRQAEHIAVQATNSMPQEQQQQQGFFEAPTSTRPAVLLDEGNTTMTSTSNSFRAPQPPLPIMIPTPRYNFDEGTSGSQRGMTRTSKGRQKIEMVRMEKGSNLQVTFSKRRAGLFKKASEISTLCGVDIALVVFSPGEKPFSFGNPSVESIVDRFLNGNIPSEAGPVAGFLEEQRARNLRLLNNELTQVQQQLESTRKVAQEVSRLLRANPSQNWWEKPINELMLPQLEHLKLALQDLRKDVTRQGENIMIDAAKLIPQTQRSSYGMGSSSGRVYLYDDKIGMITNATDNMNPPLPLPLRLPGHNFDGGHNGFY